MNVKSRTWCAKQHSIVHVSELTKMDLFVQCSVRGRNCWWRLFDSWLTVPLCHTASCLSQLATSATSGLSTTIASTSSTSATLPPITRCRFLSDQSRNRITQDMLLFKYFYDRHFETVEAILQINELDWHFEPKNMMRAKFFWNWSKRSLVCSLPRSHTQNELFFRYPLVRRYRTDDYVVMPSIYQ